MMLGIVANYTRAVNIFSMSYSSFLDSIRIVYAQVTDCVYDTFMTPICPSGIN